MSGLNKEETDEFLKECLRRLVQDRAFLRKHGWKKKNKDKGCVLWVNPKGEEYRHDMGFVGTHTQAIDKAKHDIVINAGFIQFQIQVFADESVEGHCIPSYSEEPIDWFFPCIKNGRLYWYGDAVSITCYGVETTFDTDRWLKVKSLIEADFAIDRICHGDIIEIVEFYDDYTGDWGFKLI